MIHNIETISEYKNAYVPTYENQKILDEVFTYSIAENLNFRPLNKYFFLPKLFGILWKCNSNLNRNSRIRSKIYSKLERFEFQMWNK